MKALRSIETVTRVHWLSDEEANKIDTYIKENDCSFEIAVTELETSGEIDVWEDTEEVGWYNFEWKNYFTTDF